MCVELGNITKRMQNLIIKNNKQTVELMVASATAVSPQNLWLQLCGGLWMEQGLVPAVPACLWGSWGVTVAVTSLADLWDVGGIGSYSCLLWKRLSRCPFCRGGLFSRCLC